MPFEREQVVSAKQHRSNKKRHPHCDSGIGITILSFLRKISAAAMQKILVKNKAKGIGITILSSLILRCQVG